jgi:hypothetical protein
MREKGSGMAAHVGRITGPITGRPEPVPTRDGSPIRDPIHGHAGLLWRRYLSADAFSGVAGSLVTTAMTCLLAWALLYPQGLPQEYEGAEPVLRGGMGCRGTGDLPAGRGRVPADTWLVTADGVSRMHADVIHFLFPRSRRLMHRHWYYVLSGLLTLVTGVHLTDHILELAGRAPRSVRGRRLGQRTRTQGAGVGATIVLAL